MSEKDKIKRIRERILRSGFPLEIEIGNSLREYGWAVFNQMPYVDKETEKIDRETSEDPRCSNTHRM